MSAPIFKPGDVVWHVRHGKVTLAESGSDIWPVHVWNLEDSFTEDGKEWPDDVGRVLYTLDEARQYGWLKEPRVVEGFTEVDELGGAALYLPELAGKRVHVTVREAVK